MIAIYLGSLARRSLPGSLLIGLILALLFALSLLVGVATGLYVFISGVVARWLAGDAAVAD